MNLFRRSTKSPIASPAQFRALYEREQLSVLRYALALTGGSQAEAEDITAETFLRAWKARHEFEGEAAAAIGWLIRIAKRLAIDNHRRMARARRDPSAQLPAASTPEQAVIAAEQQRFLLRLVADLPEEPREILVLRYVLGWRVNQIAAHRGTTENQVSVTLHRTLSKLKQRWVDLNPEQPLSEVLSAKENDYVTYA